VGGNSLYDFLKGSKRIKIIYEENGEKKEKEGNAEQVEHLLSIIYRNPNMKWELIARMD